MIARACSGILGVIVVCAVSTACSGGGDDDGSPTKPSGSSGSTSKGGNTSGTSGSPAVSGSSSNPAAGSAAGGTGNTAGTGSDVGGVDACAPVPDDCTANAAPGLLPFADFASDSGFYLFGNTEDKTGMTVPMGGANVVPEEIACPAGGLCTGAVTYAMHVTGGGYTIYGPSLGHDLVYPSTATPGTFEGMPQDVSMYTGVQFWARKGTTTSSPQIGITLNDESSAPAGGECDPKAVAGAPMSKACYNGFFGKVSATSGWKLYKIPFASLKQQDFGNKSMDGKFDAAKLYGLSFSLPMQTFDLWIGNVAFYQ